MVRTTKVTPRAPQQDRSRRTLDLLTGSAEAVLRRRTFDEASLQEIVDGAGVTTGAFYARFAAKNDLLRYLEEEINDALGKSARIHLQALDAESTDPVSFFHDIVSDLADIYKDNRGAIRAIIERSRSDSALRDRRRKHARRSLRNVEESLARTMGAGNPDFALKVRMGMLFVTGTLREIFLNGEFWPDDMRPPDDVVVEELVTAFFGYIHG